MANPNMARMLVEAWEDNLALAGYKTHDGLVVGWARGQAFVYLWNFRNGCYEWRRLPSRDGQQPNPAPKFDPFQSNSLYELLGGE